MNAKNNFSIIIPAYNEEKLIANSLSSLALFLPKNCTEIIVICNGCQDQTYAVAKKTIDTITSSLTAHCNFLLINLKINGKINALNEGVKLSCNKTVVLLDADIKVSSSDCAVLVKTLYEHSLLAASPKVIFDFDKSNYLVKRFYACISQSTYNKQHRIANVIALTPYAINKLFPLPQVIADDAYIQRIIGYKEYKIINKLTYKFTCPETLISTIKVQSRIIRGNLELKKIYPNLENQKNTLPALKFVDKAIFICIKVTALIIASIELKLNIKKWHQDESSRK